MMVTVLSVVTVSSIGIVLILVAGLHSRYLQARLKQVRSRNAPHYRARMRQPH